jgi:sialate O-acetylesterase
VFDARTKAPLADGSATASNPAGRWEASVSMGALANSTVRITATPTDGKGDDGSADELVLTNVAWGDVYLCSGQSNMEYPMADVFNGAAERKASTYRNLRLLNFQDVASATAQTDCKSKAPYIWAESSPKSISPRGTATDPDRGGFGSLFPSAACWFAARDILLANPTLPVGIITAAKSGAPIEVFMPAAAMVDGIPVAYGGNGTCGGAVGSTSLAASGGDGGSLSTSPPPSPPPPPTPAPPSVCINEIVAGKTGQFYNGMIAPLIPMRITAVLWYQGEENDHVGEACGGWWLVFQFKLGYSSSLSTQFTTAFDGCEKLLLLASTRSFSSFAGIERPCSSLVGWSPWACAAPPANAVGDASNCIAPTLEDTQVQCGTSAFSQQ